MSAAKLVDEALKGLERDRPEIRVSFANVSELIHKGPGRSARW
ncbi:hypothetical protein [Sorangium sp. So ce381]